MGGWFGDERRAAGWSAGCVPGLGPAGRSLGAGGQLGGASAGRGDRARPELGLGRGECQAGRPGWGRSWGWAGASTGRGECQAGYRAGAGRGGCWG